MFKIAISLLIAFASLAGNAADKRGHYDGKCYEIVDPYEKFNRAMFEVNLTLDHTILKPITSAYNKAVPSWGRDRVSNFVSNLKSPLTLVNNIAQGNGGDAHRTFWRFFINTTFGLGGLLDFASGFGLPEKQQTFGDTFAHYGADYGAYLMIPIIGPTTVRDGTGKIYDLLLDPLNLELNTKDRLVLYTANTINKRSEYLDLSNSLEESSIDYYAAIRSMYIQYLAKQNPNCKPQVINYNE